VDKVRLLVVIGCEDDEVNDALENLRLLVKRNIRTCGTYSSEFLGVLLDCLCVENLSVVLADVEILVVVLGQGNRAQWVGRQCSGSSPSLRALSCLFRVVLESSWAYVGSTLCQSSGSRCQPVSSRPSVCIARLVVG
jgi:hypothetical protein